MSERRRSLFVLLLVLGLIAGSLFAVSSRDTKLGLDLQGGVQLIFEGQPTAQQPTVTQEALQSSLDIMRERVDAFGVAEPELLLSGRNQIEVNLPGVEDAERAAEQVGVDRPALLLRLGSEHPRRGLPDQPGRELRPRNGRSRASTVRSRRPRSASRSGTTTTAPPTRRASTPSTRRASSRSTAARASSSREEALEDLSDAERANAEVVQVPEGILVVRDEKADADAPDPDRFWVIQDNPALSGTDITNPEQNFDQQGGNEPIVTFGFTDRGSRGVPGHHARDRAARPGQRASRARTRAPAHSTSRSCSTTSSSRRRPSTTSSTRTGSTADGRRDLGQLHDQLRTGPGEDPRDRRAADPPRADLALAGLRVARRRRRSTRAWWPAPRAS